MARREALTSAEGGSPKMKNLIKAPRRMHMLSWPRRRPWVKERLVVELSVTVVRVAQYCEGQAYDGSARGAGGSIVDMIE